MLGIHSFESFIKVMFFFAELLCKDDSPGPIIVPPHHPHSDMDGMVRIEVYVLDGTDVLFFYPYTETSGDPSFL